MERIDKSTELVIRGLKSLDKDHFIKGLTQLPIQRKSFNDALVRIYEDQSDYNLFVKRIKIEVNRIINQKQFLLDFVTLCHEECLLKFLLDFIFDNFPSEIKAHLRYTAVEVGRLKHDPDDNGFIYIDDL